jgi:hypothetical protein
MKDQVQELVKEYIRRANINTTIDTTTAPKIKAEIKQLISEGASHALIKEAIKHSPNSFSNYVKARLQDNLIKPGVLYYHPRAQIEQPAPIYHMTEEGDLVLQNLQECKLEMKEYLSMDDLVKYFQLRFPKIPTSAARDVGSMKYVYDTYAIPTARKLGTQYQALDIMLFSIDAAANLVGSGNAKLSRILQLSDFIDDALDLYYEKLNIMHEEGLNHA